MTNAGGNPEPQTPEPAVAQTGAQAPAAAAHPPHLEVEWNLLATVRRVIRGRWIIFACTLLGILLSVAYALHVKPYYASTAVFLPPKTSDLLTSGGALSGLASLDSADVYLGMLGSRSVADDVIDHMGLMREFGAEKRVDAERMLALSTGFSVSKNSLIQVTVVSGKPKLAADIANAYLDALFRLNGQMVASGSSYRRIFFEQQLEEQKQVLNQAENALKNTQVSTGVVLPQGEAEAGLNATAQLQAEINNAEARLAGLLTGSTEQNPEVVTARSQLAQLRAQLSHQQANSGRGPGLASNGRLPELSLEYSQKARDVRLDEGEYDALVQQYERARLASIDPGPQLQIVDRAVVAERKSGPSKRNIVTVGTMLGFAVGLVYILGIGPLRRIIRLFRDTAPHPAAAR